MTPAMSPEVLDALVDALIREAERVAATPTRSESPRGHHSSGATATATPTTRRSTYREPDYPDSATIAS
jgi:hypothetical protein